MAAPPPPHPRSLACIPEPTPRHARQARAGDGRHRRDRDLRPARGAVGAAGARAARPRACGRGDDVALLSENSPRYHECYWAALRSGLYLTAVNHHLSRGGAPTSCATAARGCWSSPPRWRELARAAGRGRARGLELRLAFGGAGRGLRRLRGRAGGRLRDVPFDDQPARQRHALLLGHHRAARRRSARRCPSGRSTSPATCCSRCSRPMYGFDADTVYLSPAPLYHAAPLRFCGMITRHRRHRRWSCRGSTPSRRWRCVERVPA